MGRFIPMLVFATMGSCPLSVFAQQQGDAATPSRVAALIAQLGDADYDRREAACETLAQIGEPAIPLLRRAVKDSNDLEIRARAFRVERNIMTSACRSESVDMTFALLWGGEFQMGSPESEADRQPDEKRHAVTIARSFLIGQYEVTQRQWFAVMEHNPSDFSYGGAGRAKIGGEGTDSMPVESITWFDAVEYCNRLSALDNLPPYYRIENIERKEKAIIAADVEIIGGLGYRLPTEAEWEYACRAGGTGAYGAGHKSTSETGNFQYRTATAYGSSSRLVDRGKTVNVGGFSPNEFGLFDMHGNVAEWCQDWYQRDYYETSPARDPAGPDKGTHRVLRGGSWLVTHARCRSAARFWNSPGEGKFFTGLRVARTASKYLISEP